MHSIVTRSGVDVRFILSVAHFFAIKSVCFCCFKLDFFNFSLFRLIISSFSQSQLARLLMSLPRLS